MRYPPGVRPGDTVPAAPLAAWAGALVIALLAGLAGWMIAVESGASAPMAFVEFNRARADALRGKDRAANAATVVMLGSSSLKYATRQEPEFAGGVSKLIGRPVQVLRIISNWGTFSDYVPLAMDLAALKPDLVLLERQLVTTDRPRIRSFLLLVEGTRERLGIASPLSSSAEDEAYVQYEHPCWMRGVGRRLPDHLHELNEWVAQRPDGPAATAARQFVEDLVAAGATVALVDIPRRPDYEKEMQRARETAKPGARPADLPDRVVHWEHLPLDTNLYCDLTHVTPAGQEVLSAWLESKIAEALARPTG